MLIDEVFIDQLLADGYTVIIGGGELATDAHYVVSVRNSNGAELARATGYSLQETFIEAFMMAPARTNEVDNA